MTWFACKFFEIPESKDKEKTAQNPFKCTHNAPQENLTKENYLTVCFTLCIDELPPASFSL